MFRKIMLAIAAIWLALAGCTRTDAPPAPNQPATPKSHGSTVAPIFGKRPETPIDLRFSIQWSSTAKPEEGWMKWDASYRSHGKTARFRLELTGGKAAKDSPFVPGHGFFYRVPGSDCGGLLADLKPVLGANHPPKRGKRVDKLAFDLAILGVDQSRAPDTGESFGGFQSEPPGDWMTVKVFLPNDIEFFLNINSNAGEAEFSMKDESYGDDILKKLATVL
jgi:hypothetical protein